MYLPFLYVSACLCWCWSSVVYWQFKVFLFSVALLFIIRNFYRILRHMPYSLKTSTHTDSILVFVYGSISKGVVGFGVTFLLLFQGGSLPGIVSVFTRAFCLALRTIFVFFFYFIRILVILLMFFFL